MKLNKNQIKIHFISIVAHILIAEIHEEVIVSKMKMDVLEHRNNLEMRMKNMAHFMFTLMAWRTNEKWVCVWMLWSMLSVEMRLEFFVCTQTQTQTLVPGTSKYNDIQLLTIYSNELIYKCMTSVFPW